MDMAMFCGWPNGRGRARAIGKLLTVAGAILLLWVLPARLWVAALGLLLLAAGLMLWRAG